MPRKLVRAAFVPLALLCVAIMRLLNRLGIVTIRIGVLYPPSRLGHVAMNTECYLCERDAGLQPKRTFDVWTYRNEAPNEYYAKMLRREMLVDRSGFSSIVALCNSLFVGWQKYVAGSQQLDRDIHNLLEKYPPHLRLSQREEMIGKNMLSDWGVPAHARFVCLIVRDAAYIPILPYHSFRDADIDTYEQAALMLARRGYYVFRMGAKVAKPFSARHKRIFDYATNGMRSEFMDIYLGAHCAFAMSTSTGWDAIPQVFRRPICYTNFPQFEYLPTWQRNSLAIWKHLEKDDKRMTVAEIATSGAGQFMKAEQFKEAGITLVANTAQEIATVAEEMAYGYVPDYERQQRFWKAYPRTLSPYNGVPLHGEIRLRIGSEFLRGYDVQGKENTGIDSGAGRLETRTVQEHNALPG